MAFQEILLQGEGLGPHERKTVSPILDVSKWDRLHFHISAGRRSVAGLQVRILFGTLVGQLRIHADSTVWFENGISEREFSYTVPSLYNGTGFVMSVPVIAPELVSIELTNTEEREFDETFVTVMAQEI